jgi:formate hydrogenlyase subunit 6/NADH:ubiquinone oxidoreductase subunit I
VCPTGALKSKKEWLLEQGMDSHSIMQMTSIERKRRTKRQEFKEEPLDVK